MIESATSNVPEISAFSCRICLKTCSKKALDAKKFAEQYRFCTGFQIRDEDIPKKVCPACAMEVKRFWDFRNKCNQTEIFLTDFIEVKIETVKIENETFTEETRQDELEDGKRKRYKIKMICEVCGCVCNDQYYFKKHYNRHFLTEDAPKMFCDICLQKQTTAATTTTIGFTSKDRLIEHMKNHHLLKTTMKRKRTCIHCGKVFTSQSAMKFHIYRHHVDPKDYQYECLICSRRFFCRRHLERHNRSHTGEKAYSCSICGAKFGRKDHMKIHVNNIHNPTQKSCEFCGKTFTSLKYLKQHLQTHDQGGYVCPLCPTKAFSLTTTLRSHMKTNHPTFPLPPPGTKLKGYDWSKAMQEIGGDALINVFGVQ